MLRSTSAASSLLACVLLASAVSVSAAMPQAAKPRVDQVHASEAVKLQQQHDVATQMKIDAIWEGARANFREAREYSELVRRARRGDRAAIRGLRVRRTGNDEGAPVNEPLPAWALQAPAMPAAATAVPTNVRCNNPTADGDAAGAGQAEEFVAAIGNQIVVAWNNGQGFNTGGDIQGYAWSNDGGATYTDGGSPPHPGAYPSFRWTSDPVMTVNAKTGDYYYCGLCNTDASHNAIAIARGRFTGGVFAFDSVFVVRIVASVSQFLDKQWVACDSISGNVYVTNTTFGASDTIDFYRSTNAGRSWSSPTTMSSNAEAGYVQGSRVAVGPTGDVSVTWYSIGTATNNDFLQFRRSTSQGVSFGAAVSAASPYMQFGTGAPGFNRERGINFPSIAVDNTSGPHRGRIFLAWNECNAFLDLGLPVVGATNRVEVEQNGTSATANAFTPGQILRGTLATASSTLDQDWYSFSLSAGQTFVAYMDSMTTGRGWYLRLLSPDGIQRLCLGGKPDSTTGSNYAYYSFTAPVSGTYYLRLIASSYRTIGYRILTGIYSPVSEPGRDQRDAFVAYSDNGTTWTSPIRVDNDGIGYDNFLPEIAVGADGADYVRWFDHRDETYGSKANVYMTQSVDGGATWAANVPVTSVQSNFTTSPCNIAPNMGDYSGLCSSGTRIVPTWADGRLATGSGVDVYSASIDITSDISVCASDTSVTAPSTSTRAWTFANHDVVFGGTYTATLTSQRNWPMPAPAAVAVAAGGTTRWGGDITAPDTAAAGINRICVTLTSPGGVVVKQCCFNLTVIASAGVGGNGPYGLALAAGRPNPAPGRATIAFSLPEAGQARLVVYDLGGARVRTLVNGYRPAGEASVTWDGADEHGRPVRAGAYFYRLEFGGRQLTQRIVIVR